MGGGFLFHLESGFAEKLEEDPYSSRMGCEYAHAHALGYVGSLSCVTQMHIHVHIHMHIYFTVVTKALWIRLELRNVWFMDDLSLFSILYP